VFITLSETRLNGLLPAPGTYVAEGSPTSRCRTLPFWVC